jgi:histidinol-phosphate aminotransferase
MERRRFVETGLAAAALGLAGRAARGAPLGAIAHRSSRPGTAHSLIRLSANENPLGLSPRARRAVVEAIAEANRYPGEWRTQLVAALAAKHQVQPEQVVLGNGSSEVLQMVVQAAGPEATVVVADPTFEDVPHYAGYLGLRVERVPLTARYEHDLDRFQTIVARTAGPVLAYVCNPNNPTGTLTPSAELDRWIASVPERVTVAVDEAYFEYAEDPGYHSALGWIAEHPNVIVVRTFSKIYAMAGMRLGYGLAHPVLAAKLERFAAGNNTNQLALAAGLASLEDGAFARESLDLNRRARAILYRALEALDLEYLPSQTNFVMHRITGDLSTYIARMRERGFAVGRPFPPMLDYNRVSLGLPEEMEAFAAALHDFRRRGWV